MKHILTLTTLLTLIGCQSEDRLSWTQINAEIEQKFYDVSHISIEEFIDETRDNEDVLIIDVRKTEEYQVSHIPGAINITDTKKIAQIINETNKDVIVYCSVGYRSAIVAQELQSMTENDVANFQGSIFAWANENMPMVDQNGITEYVHPYDSYWGQLLEKDVPQKFSE